MSREMLTVVHVVRQFHPAIGGMENFVEQLALHQVAAGHRVRVVTLNRIFDDPTRKTLAGNDKYRGISVQRLHFIGSRRYPIAPGVLGAVQGADVVHVHGVDFFCDFLAAFAWAHRIPMILTTHGGYFHTSFARRLKEIYFRTATRASLSQFGAVIAGSAEDARLFNSIAGSRVRLVSNPVDTEKFEGLADRRSDTLIYFGRLAPNKGLEDLIAWFAGLARGDPRWRLIIAGKPMGTSIRTLRAAVEAGQLTGRVEIHETPTNDELRRLIAASGIYCCASSYEGFGLAAIEGASAGLYPLLSDIPPFRSSVERLGYGMLVDFSDRSTWPASYDELPRSLDIFRRDHDGPSIRTAIEPFSWIGALSAFIDIYRRVLGQRSRKIADVEVPVLNKAAATGMILNAAQARRPMLVAFCNAHTSNVARRDPQMRSALRGALVLNDGVGLDIASRLLFGSPFPENLNGTDLIPHLLSASTEPLKVYLLGGMPGVAEAAAQSIASKYPAVQVVGVMHGFFDEKQSQAVVDEIKRSDANLVLVAMGQPRQELWGADYFHNFSGPTLCVGALFDFLAERVPRARPAIRKARLEWAYRLLNEPHRLWRRYLLGNVLFMGRILSQKLVGTRI